MPTVNVLCTVHHVHVTIYERKYMRHTIYSKSRNHVSLIFNISVISVFTRFNL